MKSDKSTVKVITEKTGIEGLMESLRNDPEIGPRLKAMEALDEEAKSCVEFVDLDIAFSPVLLNGTTTAEAVIVDYRGEDGRGVIKEPYHILSLEEHKMARARFLCARGREMQPMMDRLKSKLK